jgi:hypothetical protein
MLQSAELRPPVAMLVYMQDEPSQAAFYPFAEFSPEWQALQWASRQGVATRFIDLPQTHGMAIEFARREALKKAAQEAEDAVQAAAVLTRRAMHRMSGGRDAGRYAGRRRA